MAHERSVAVDLPVKPIELSVPLASSHETNIYIQLTIQAASIILFMTTAGSDTNANSNLGSFVCALPSRLTSDQTISTPLYTQETSLDFTIRMAKLLARKLQIQVYVGNSISLSHAGMGCTVEEEIECFKKVINVVMSEVEKTKKP